MIPESELDAPRTIEQYQAAVDQVRRHSARRRTVAWASVPETVLGINLRPLTPAIYTALSGTGNAFLSDANPREHDLRNFVWFCSPSFNPDNPGRSAKWRRWQMLRLRMALGKRRRGQSRSVAVMHNFASACAEVYAILDAAFADSKPRVDGPSRPIAASFEAQLVDSFAREYLMWPLPQPIRHTPIKQLMQMARCIDRRTLGADDKYFDRAENDTDRRFLEAINQRN